MSGSMAPVQQQQMATMGQSASAPISPLGAALMPPQQAPNYANSMMQFAQLMRQNQMQANPQPGAPNTAVAGQVGISPSALTGQPLGMVGNSPMLGAAQTQNLYNIGQ